MHPHPHRHWCPHTSDKKITAVFKVWGKGQCPLPPHGVSKITCSCQHPQPQPHKLLTSTTVPCHVPRTAQRYIPKGAILERPCWARDMFPSHRGFLSLPLTGPVLQFPPLWQCKNPILKARNPERSPHLVKWGVKLPALDLLLQD